MASHVQNILAILAIRIIYATSAQLKLSIHSAQEATLLNASYIRVLARLKRFDEHSTCYL